MTKDKKPLFYDKLLEHYKAQDGLVTTLFMKCISAEFWGMGYGVVLVAASVPASGNPKILQQLTEIVSIEVANYIELALWNGKLEIPPKGKLYTELDVPEYAQDQQSKKETIARRQAEKEERERQQKQAKLEAELAAKKALEPPPPPSITVEGSLDDLEI